MNEKN